MPGDGIAAAPERSVQTPGLVLMIDTSRMADLAALPDEDTPAITPDAVKTLN
jgi:hypothetical protein